MTYPPDFKHPKEKMFTAQIAAGVITTKASAHRAVVQAGGCVGLWPLALSKYFEQVYTFEPSVSNFRCLQMNVAPAGNIAAVPCALGDMRTSVGLTRPKAHAGLWRVDGEGDVPMEPLDDVLGDVVVDALVLDVEGSEVPVWRGAERLIATHRPLLWFEYLHHTAAIDAFLDAHGYLRPVRTIGRDCYSVHASRVVH